MLAVMALWATYRAVYGRRVASVKIRSMGRCVWCGEASRRVIAGNESESSEVKDNGR